MAGSDAGSVVAVKVFMKGNEIAPVGIGLKLLRAAENRLAAVAAAEKDARESLRDFTSDFPKVLHPPRSGRTFDLVTVT